MVAAASMQMTCSNSQLWCADGEFRQDLPDGSPANVVFYKDGSVRRVAHYRHGKIHAPTCFCPAVIEYYPAGAIKATLHYQYGKYQEQADGCPAGIHYSEDGKISGGCSVGKGKISASHAKHLIKAAQISRVAALLAKADQSVVPAGGTLTPSLHL